MCFIRKGYVSTVLMTDSSLCRVLIICTGDVMFQEHCAMGCHKVTVVHSISQRYLDIYSTYSRLRRLSSSFRFFSLTHTQSYAAEPRYQLPVHHCHTTRIFHPHLATSTSAYHPLSNVLTLSLSPAFMSHFTPSATPLASPKSQPAYDAALVRIAVLVFCFVAVLFGILIYAISESRAPSDTVTDSAVRLRTTDDTDEKPGTWRPETREIPATVVADAQGHHPR